MKGFLQQIGIQMKCIFRKSSWSVLLFLAILTSLGTYWFCFAHKAPPIFLFPQTAFGQAFLTLIFMIIGVELRRELREVHLEDVANAYQKSPIFLPLAHIATIIILATLVTAIIMAGFLIPLVLDSAPYLWLYKSGLLIILLYYLPCIVLGILGLLISQVNSRKDVYLPATLLWLLTSSLVNHLTGAIPAYNYFARSITQFVNMGFNNFQMYQNVVTGAKIELPRWIVRIGFAIGFAMMYITHYNADSVSSKAQKKRARILMGTVLISAILIMSSLFNSYAEFFFRFADDLYTDFFTNVKSYEYLSGDGSESVNFAPEKNITQTHVDIELDCTSHGLSADVVITSIVERDTVQQAFTLFSNFIVDEIRVDGEPVNYRRAHDYIMVDFPTKKNKGDEIVFTFCYHGYSLASYPVNETTVQLNRAFPWLPWPGIKSVSENEVDMYTESSAFFVEKEQMGDPVMYTLRYKGPGDLYTNLTEQSQNTYFGMSNNGVCLYSGMILTEYRGIHTYVPAALYRERKACADAILDIFPLITEYCEKYDVPNKPEMPENLVVIQMKMPLWSSINFQTNELFSWGSEWELRLSNESSTVLEYLHSKSSIEEYQNDPETIVGIIIPYMLSPSAGYPTNANPNMTCFFTDLLAAAVQSKEWNENEIQMYAELVCTEYFYQDGNTLQKLVEVFTQMRSGTNYDPILKNIYHRLLALEPISADQVLSELSCFEEG